jgi:hypothetical protein
MKKSLFCLGLLLFGPSVRADCPAATVAFDNWQDRKAEQILRRYLAAHPRDGQAWIQLERVNLATGHMHAAELDLSRAPAGPEVELERIHQLGELTSDRDRYFDGLDAVKQRSPAFYLERARSQGFLHNPDSQRKDLEALTESPQVCRARFAFALSQQDWDRAESELGWFSEHLPAGRGWVTLLEMQREQAAARGQRSRELQGLRVLARLYDQSDRPLDRLRCHLRLAELGDPMGPLPALPEALSHCRAAVLAHRETEAELLALPASPWRGELWLRHLQARLRAEGGNPATRDFVAEDRTLPRTDLPGCSPEQNARLRELRAHFLNRGSRADKQAAADIWSALLEQRLGHERWERQQDALSPQSLLSDVSWTLVQLRQGSRAEQLLASLHGRLLTPNAQMVLLETETLVGHPDVAARAALLPRLGEDDQLNLLENESDDVGAKRLLLAMLQRHIQRFTEQQSWARLAKACDQLADLYQGEGQLLQAVDASRQSVEALRREGDPKAYVNGLGTLAFHYELADQNEMTLLTLRRQLALTTGPAERALLLLYIAEQEQSHERVALGYLRQAEQEPLPDNHNSRVLRHRLAAAKIPLLSRLGELPEALRLSEKLRLETPIDSTERVLITGEEAGVREALGNLAEAESLYREALELSSRPTLRFLVPAEATYVRITTCSSFYAFLRKQGRNREAFQVLLPILQRSLTDSPHSAKAGECWIRALEDMVHDGSLVEALPLARSAFGNPALASRVLASAVLARAPALEPLLTRLRRAEVSPGSPRSAYFEAQANVGADRPEWRNNLLLSPTSVDALAAHLSPQQLLVSYFPVGSNLVVLALERGGAHVATVPIDAARFSRQCRQWHDLLSAGKTDPALTRSLQAALIDPLVPWMKDKELLVALTGQLWYVPLESLPGLESTRGVTRVNPGDLLHLLSGDWHPYRSGATLALGAPTDDLPGARQELESIARRLPGCELRVGAEASREALFRLAPEARLIHLATHSRANADDPLQGSLDLADGHLTLPDIYALRLTHSPLVVLSSCCSGLGQASPGNEPISLATAFSAAGASSVLSSLWPVDDEQTRELFDDFYSALAAGKSPLQSLRAAQALSRQRHPGSTNWSAFVLSGCPD